MKGWRGEPLTIRRIMSFTFESAIVMVLHRLGGLGVAYMGIAVLFIIHSVAKRERQTSDS